MLANLLTVTEMRSLQFFLVLICRSLLSPVLELLKGVLAVSMLFV